MWKWRELLLLLTSVLSCAAVGQQSGKDSADTFRAPISQFQVRSETALEALLRLSEQTHIPFGVIQADGRLCTTKITLNIQHQPPQIILDRILGRIQGYRWQLRDGVLIIEPSLTPSSTKQFLEMTIPSYGTPKTNHNGLGQWLWVNVRAVLRPTEGTAGVIGGSSGEPTWQIELRNASVEQILNAIVSKAGGAWVLRPVPSDLQAAAARQQLFTIGSFTTQYHPQGLGEIIGAACRERK